MNVKYVIDGYNLLHASPLIQTGSGPKWLEKQRFRLMSTLGSLMSAEDRNKTIVVFDARESPARVPSEYSYEGILVRFARDHDEADDLIEELIEAHASTSSLTVVSSDVRLQRAARRRKAAFSDSRAWFDALQAAKRSASIKAASPDPEGMKETTLDAKEVADWIDKMGISESDVRPADQIARHRNTSPFRRKKPRQ